MEWNIQNGGEEAILHSMHSEEIDINAEENNMPSISQAPCENSLQQTSNINEEQKDLKDLFRISDDLRKNMADIFILLKNKQSYKEIEKNSVATKDIIREKIIHSDLNEQFKSKVNLN